MSVRGLMQATTMGFNAARRTGLFPSCLRAFLPSCLVLALAPSALAQDKVTYQDHVLPIFRNACLNCHNPEKKKAGLDLSSYGGVMTGSENGKSVEGWGLFEHGALGRHDPSGFADWLTVAP